MDHGLPPRRILPRPVPPVPPSARHAVPVDEPQESLEARTADEDETQFVPDEPAAAGAEGEAPATGSHRVLVVRPSRKRWIPAGAGAAVAAIAAAVLLSTGMLEQQAPVADEAAVTEAAVPSATVTTPPTSMPAVPTLDLAPGTPGTGSGGPATGRSTSMAAPAPTSSARPAPVTSTPSLATPPPVSATSSSPPSVESTPPATVDSSSPSTEAPVVVSTDASPGTETPAG